jgi:hypothetical protein
MGACREEAVSKGETRAASDLEEVDIQIVSAGQELVDDLHAVVKGEREDPHSGAHRIATANPIPETKDVLLVDPYQGGGREEVRVRQGGREK